MTKEQRSHCGKEYALGSVCREDSQQCYSCIIKDERTQAQQDKVNEIHKWLEKNEWSNERLNAQFFKNFGVKE